MSFEILMLFVFVVLCIVYTFGLGGEAKASIKSVDTSNDNNLPKTQDVNASVNVTKPTEQIVGGMPAGRIRSMAFGGGEPAPLETLPMGKELSDLNRTIMNDLGTANNEPEDKPDIISDNELNAVDNGHAGRLREDDPIEQPGSVVAEPNAELIKYYGELREKLIRADNANAYKTIIGYHYADWCKYCVEFKPVWQCIEKTISKNPKFQKCKLTQIDHDIDKLTSIKTIPCLIKNTPDGRIEKYSEPRTVRRLLRWMLV